MQKLLSNDRVREASERAASVDAQTILGCIDVILPHSHLAAIEFTIAVLEAIRKTGVFVAFAPVAARILSPTVFDYWPELEYYVENGVPPDTPNDGIAQMTHFYMLQHVRSVLGLTSSDRPTTGSSSLASTATPAEPKVSYAKTNPDGTVTGEVLIPPPTTPGTTTAATSAPVVPPKLGSVPESPSAAETFAVRPKLMPTTRSRDLLARGSDAQLAADAAIAASAAFSTETPTSLAQAASLGLSRSSSVSTPTSAASPGIPKNPKSPNGGNRDMAKGRSDDEESSSSLESLDSDSDDSAPGTQITLKKPSFLDVIRQKAKAMVGDSGSESSSSSSAAKSSVSGKVSRGGAKDDAETTEQSEAEHDESSVESSESASELEAELYDSEVYDDEEEELDDLTVDDEEEEVSSLESLAESESQTESESEPESEPESDSGSEPESEYSDVNSRSHANAKAAPESGSDGRRGPSLTASRASLSGKDLVASAQAMAARREQRAKAKVDARARKLEAKEAKRREREERRKQRRARPNAVADGNLTCHISTYHEPLPNQPSLLIQAEAALVRTPTYGAGSSGSQVTRSSSIARDVLGISAPTGADWGLPKGVGEAEAQQTSAYAVRYRAIVDRELRNFRLVLDQLNLLYEVFLALSIPEDVDSADWIDDLARLGDWRTLPGATQIEARLRTMQTPQCIMTKEIASRIAWHLYATQRSRWVPEWNPYRVGDSYVYPPLLPPDMVQISAAGLALGLGATGSGQRRMSVGSPTLAPASPTGPAASPKQRPLSPKLGPEATPRMKPRSNSIGAIFTVTRASDLHAGAPSTGTATTTSATAGSGALGSGIGSGPLPTMTWPRLDIPRMSVFAAARIVHLVDSYKEPFALIPAFVHVAYHRALTRLSEVDKSIITASRHMGSVKNYPFAKFLSKYIVKRATVQLQALLEDKLSTPVTLPPSAPAPEIPQEETAVAALCDALFTIANVIYNCDPIPPETESLLQFSLRDLPYKLGVAFNAVKMNAIARGTKSEGVEAVRQKVIFIEQTIRKIENRAWAPKRALHDKLREIVVAISKMGQ